MWNRFFVLLLGILSIVCVFAHSLIASDPCSFPKEGSFPIRRVAWDPVKTLKLFEGKKPAEEKKSKASLFAPKPTLDLAAISETKVNRNPLDKFLEAAKFGNLTLIRNYLAESKNRYLIEGQNGIDALAMAVSHNHDLVVLELLKHKINLNLTHDGRSILHWAILMKKKLKEGRRKTVITEDEVLRMVELLVKAGASVTPLASDGKTAVHLATLRGYPRVIAFLLRELEKQKVKGLLVNSVTPGDDITALHFAAIEGHEEVAKSLLQKGANPEARSYDGSTPLHMAASKGHLLVIKELLQRKASPTTSNALGRTPLHIAANHKQAEVLAHLLPLIGKDKIDLLDKDGYSALHLASREGCTECVKTLIGKGAQVNLPQKVSKSTALQIASTKGHLATVQALVSAGASLSVRDARGLNALQSAATSPHSDVVRFLAKSYRDKGISIDERLSGQNTALSIAATKGHLENVKGLLENKADANLTGFSGATALHEAAGRGDVAIVTALLPHQKNLDQLNDEGKSALSQASFFGHPGVFEELAKAGASLNIRHKKSRFTPLHFAVLRGHLPAVKMLVELGADQTLKNSNGEWPISLARKTNQTAIVEFLEAKKKTR